MVTVSRWRALFREIRLNIKPAMSDFSSSVIPPFEAIRAVIERNQSFYLTTHVGPDGDAIGPALALKTALENLGKTVTYVSRDGVPQSSQFLARTDQVSLAPPSGVHYDCAFVLDCDGTPARVASPYEPISGAKERVIIDHHRTSKAIFETNWIDPSQAATAMMVYALLRALELPIDAGMAQGLMTGLSCDTGHFRFDNTSPAVLAAASYLVERGADASQVAFRLFDERSFVSTQLLGIALSKMQSANAGQLVWTALSMSDFLSVGTGDESVENVVNFLRNCKSARLAMIFRERRDENGTLAARVSVRSVPELRADLFAAEWGGGGHAVAAGFRLKGNFDRSVEEVLARAQEWLEEQHEPVR